MDDGSVWSMVRRLRKEKSHNRNEYKRSAKIYVDIRDGLCILWRKEEPVRHSLLPSRTGQLGGGRKARKCSMKSSIFS